jgi:hypothetical protein
MMDGLCAMRSICLSLREIWGEVGRTGGAFIPGDGVDRRRCSSAFDRAHELIGPGGRVWSSWGFPKVPAYSPVYPSVRAAVCPSSISKLLLYPRPTKGLLQDSCDHPNGPQFSLFWVWVQWLADKENAFMHVKSWEILNFLVKLVKAIEVSLEKMI